MLKTLEKIQALPWVMYVDDERGDGNSIIITLHEGYFFADEPDCGVRGFDTVREAVEGTRKRSVIGSKS